MVLIKGPSIIYDSILYHANLQLAITNTAAHATNIPIAIDTSDALIIDSQSEIGFIGHTSVIGNKFADNFD